MAGSEVLLILFMLVIKHFICDFPLQAHPWQYTNKGTYGHPGGLTHSGLHVVGTLVVMSFFVTYTAALILAFIDGFAHYHIDWVKMNVNKKFGWGPLTSEWFWVSLGVDQFLHSLTYLGLVFLIV